MDDIVFDEVGFVLEIEPQVGGVVTGISFGEAVVETTSAESVSIF